MAFPDAEKLEWVKNKLMFTLVGEYDTAEAFIGFINDTMPLGIRTEIRDRLGEEVDMHGDIKDNFEDLKEEINVE